MSRPALVIVDGALEIRIELRGSRAWISTLERKALGSHAVSPLAAVEVEVPDLVQAIRHLVGTKGVRP